LSKTADGWKVDAVAKDLLTQGVHGYAREGDLVQIGPDAYGWLLDSYGGNRGYSVGSYTLVYEYRGRIAQLHIEDTGGDNEGACGYSACKSSIQHPTGLPRFNSAPSKRTRNTLRSGFSSK
jgi:hypothetical protein